MPAPVSLVTIHHEGGGAPAPPANIGRVAHGGYTYGIGTTAWERFRDVWSSYATLNFNGVSLDIVLTGDRHTGYPVTDLDIDLIRSAVADARARGYVVNAPTVRDHSQSPGSATACSGNNTRARWTEIVAACSASSSGGGAAPGGDDDMPADKDVVDQLVTAEGTWQLQFDGGVKTIRGPFYGSYFSLPASVRNDPQRRFRVLSAPGDGSARGYDLVSVKGEQYAMRTKA
jgi:hypothetical protein